ncbi:MAG: hypothetical protein J5748_05070 [Bacteroidales bacterium]|nr:hypothetical protein [Bacteroidales bacterium]
MKKYLIIAAAAIVAMASCSKTEFVDLTPDTAITFSVVNHLLQTKGQDLPYAGLAYPQDVPFGTFAWWTKDEWTGIAADQTMVFMDNQEVTYHPVNNVNVWAPTSTYYWTKSGYITFASYSPYTTAANASVDGYSEVPEYDVDKGFVFTNYTIVDDTDIDLMYADLAANCGKNTNSNGALVTDNSNPESAFSGVPTIFNHALCKIGFAFRAIGQKNPNVTEIKIEITDVDIVNIDNKGTFNQIPAANATKWASDHSEIADYDYQPAGTFELSLIENTAANLASTDNYTALGKTRILLPQALGADDDPTDPTADPIATTTDQKLVVAYTIKTKYASAPNEWAIEEVVSEVRLNNGGLTSWLDNRNITYRISINPYSNIPVTFDPAVVDWANQYSTDVNLNENED